MIQVKGKKSYARVREELKESLGTKLSITNSAAKRKQVLELIARRAQRSGGFIKVGVSVYLRTIINSTEVVAKGWIKSLDPNKLVGGEEIWSNLCEVNVQVVIKRDKCLVRPYGLFLTIEDAIGATVAWPCTFVSVAQDDA